MSADALAPCSPVAMILAMWNKQVLVFQEEGFQLRCIVSVKEWYKLKNIFIFPRKK